MKRIFRQIFDLFRLILLGVKQTEEILSDLKEDLKHENDTKTGSKSNEQSSTEN